MGSNPKRQLDAREVFLRVVELEPDTRSSRLDAECGDDTALRQEVEALLAALAEAESGDADGGSNSTRRIEVVAAEQPGATIGPYKLLERIGEGGMGAVFLAEQREPVARRVALKVLRSDLDSKQVVARFEAERQALALMEHPHIARVLDAGQTEAGRPFFVMELVKGEPITTFCDGRNLTLRERLDLFVHVCHAVQHAHQKGVIHRDLKPTNVLVMEADGRVLPKVIDFGIAKATTAHLTDKTLFTEFQALLGTPDYMSPEQAEGSLDIDTRADVYALGVLLYELLVGSTPFDPRRLRAAPLRELLRILREDEPERPSTRADTATQRSQSIAFERGTEPAKLGALVRGELDWIVMKCLEKDRAARYQTAAALADDVQRFLRDEPTLASPPRLGYRVQKFVRRNRGFVVAASLLLLSLVAGIIGTSYGLVEARAAEGAQSELRAAAEREKELADLARDEAERLQRLADARATDIAKQLYGTQTRLAMVAFEAGDVARARRLLAETDPDARGWEWSYLDWLLDRSVGRGRAHLPATAVDPARMGAPFTHTADMRLAAYSDTDGLVTVVEVEPLRTVVEFRAFRGGVAGFESLPAERVPHGPIFGLQFTADGTRVVAYAYDSRDCRVFDARTGELVATLEGSGAAREVVLDPSGRRMTSDRPVVWDLRSGAQICELEVPPTGRLEALESRAFSVDGSEIYGACAGAVFAWDTATGRLLRRVVDPDFAAFSVIAAPDGRSLIVTGRNKVREAPLVLEAPFEGVQRAEETRLYDVASGEMRRRLGQFGVIDQAATVLEPSMVAFSKDGRFLAAPRESRVDVVELISGRRVNSVAVDALTGAASLRFGADDRSLVVGDWRRVEGGFEVWWARFGFETSEPAFTIPTSVLGDAQLRFDPSGTELLVLRSRDRVDASLAYSTEHGRVVRELSAALPAAVSPNARHLVRVVDDSASQRVQVMPLAGVGRPVVSEPHGADPEPAGSAIHEFPVGDLTVTAVACTDAADRAAVAAADLRALDPPVGGVPVRILEVETGRPIVSLHGCAAPVIAMEFSPDGAALWARDASGVSCLWEVGTARRVKRWTRAAGHAFDHTGRRMVVCTAELGGVVLDARSGEEVVRLGNWTLGTSAAFHPGGTRLVGAAPGSIGVWDATNGAELLRLDASNAAWNAVAFDAEGRRLAAIDDSGDLRVWECVEAPEAIRRERGATWIRARAREFARELYGAGWVGEDFVTRLERLVADRRVDPRVASAARELARGPDPAWAHRVAAVVRPKVLPRRRAPDAAVVRGAEIAAALAPEAPVVSSTCGMALLRAGRPAEAIGMLERACALRAEPASPATAIDRAFLAMAQHETGATDVALATFVEAAKTTAPAGSKAFESVGEASALLAGLPMSLSEMDARGSIVVAEASLEFVQAVLGPEHRLVGTGYDRLAALTEQTREYDRSLHFAQRALDISVAARNGDEIQDRFGSVLKLMRARGDLAGAEAAYANLQRRLAPWYEERPWEAAPVHRRMAAHARIARQFDRMVECADFELAARATRYDRDPTCVGLERAQAHYKDSITQRNLMRYSDAVASAAAEVRILESELGPGNLRLVLAQGSLGALLQVNGDSASAIPYFESVIEVLRQISPAHEVRLILALANLGHCELIAENWATARAALTEAVERGRREYPQGYWAIDTALTLLGEIELAHGNLDAAEELIVEAAGRLRAPRSLPFRKAEAVERAVKLYEALVRERPGQGHEESLATWRERLDELRR